MKLVINKEEMLMACSQYIKKIYGLEVINPDKSKMKAKAYKILGWKTLNNDVFLKVDVARPGREKLN